MIGTKYAAIILTLISISNSASGEDLNITEYFIDGTCHVGEAMHATHNFKTNSMISGEVNGGYAGQSRLKIGFVHTANDEGGYETSLRYTWDKYPVDGEIHEEERYFILSSTVIVVSADYISYTSHNEALILSRTYKNEWHGILNSFGVYKDDRASSFAYPLKCKIIPEVDGPLELLEFRTNRISDKLGLKDSIN